MTAKLTIEEIKINGNAGKLTKAELARRANEEPRVSGVHSGRPRMPKHLSPEGVVAWREATRLLKQRGTLSAGDGPTLEIYAETRARWIAAKKDLAERGLQISVTMLDKNGNPVEREKANPNLKVAEVCEKQLLALAKSLGLTPDTREKVKPPRPDPKDTPLSPTSMAAMHPEWFDKKGKLKNGIKF